MSSFAIDLSYLSLNSLHGILVALGLLPLNALFHLVTIFRLLANCNFKAIGYHQLDVVVQMSLVKANDLVTLPRRNAQVQMFRTSSSVLKVNDKPVSKAIKNHLVKVLVLNLPIPIHSWRESFPLHLWNVQGRRIVVRITRATLVCITHAI